MRKAAMVIVPPLPPLPAAAAWTRSSIPKASLLPEPYHILYGLPNPTLASCRIIEMHQLMDVGIPPIIAADKADKTTLYITIAERLFRRDDLRSNQHLLPLDHRHEHNLDLTRFLE